MNGLSDRNVLDGIRWKHLLRRSRNPLNGLPDRNVALYYRNGGYEIKGRNPLNGLSDRNTDPTSVPFEGSSMLKVAIPCQIGTYIPCFEEFYGYNVAIPWTVFQIGTSSQPQCRVHQNESRNPLDGLSDRNGFPTQHSCEGHLERSQSLGRSFRSEPTIETKVRVKNESRNPLDGLSDRNLGKRRLQQHSSQSQSLGRSFRSELS